MFTLRVLFDPGFILGLLEWCVFQSRLDNPETILRYIRASLEHRTFSSKYASLIVRKITLENRLTSGIPNNLGFSERCLFIHS